jgi:hypothetical protein
MNPEDKIILDKYVHIWNQFKKDSTMKDLDYNCKKQLEKVYMNLFKGSGVDLSCSICVANMFKKVYNHYDNAILRRT